jgi:hypothetical protein
MSANGNGGRCHYYACSGRQKYGPKACDGERLPREKTETAVIDQLAALYRDEQVISGAFAKANAEAETRRPEFEQRLASISAEITRAEQALELPAPSVARAENACKAGSGRFRTRSQPFAGFALQAGQFRCSLVRIGLVGRTGYCANRSDAEVITPPLVL